ncbi:MAG: energy transducer TonB [Betaproteobacteria bacterium HGW-Betaproteobacteria-22]|nr:MAG: energy transducer TonB [Betaproteobacteria bacterium HGW-Betaproteobacteria-22]
MSHILDRIAFDKLAGLSLVILLHVALLYAAMSYKLIPAPQEAVTLFVHLINPSPPKKEEPPPPEPPKPPPPKKVTLVKEKPVPRPEPAPVLVAEAPVTQATDYVAPAPPPAPVVEAPPAPVPEPVVEVEVRPTGPVTLSSELSLACPQRTLPRYPVASRRIGEHGRVVLRVELDETGQITGVKVKESSGHRRLDEAGMAAVKTWQCDAAMRDGKAVPAVAMQPFDFILN